MKKSLIALAVASVAGSASAQVTVSGFFNASYDMFSIGNSTRTSNKSENRVSDNSSRVLFNASEDLGGGLKAIGQFDLRIPTDAQWRGSGVTQGTSEVVGCTPLVAGGKCTVAVNGIDPAPNQLASGNQHVGLEGNFGAVRFGRQDIHYTENGNFMPASTAIIQSHAHLLVLAAENQFVGRTSRTANLIWWTSPVMSGLQATLGYSTNGYAASSTQDTENDLASGQRKGSSTYIKLGYTAGPLALVFSNLNEKSDWYGTVANTAVATAASGAAALAASNAQADRKGYILSGKYTLGAIKLGLGYGHSESTNSINAATSPGLVTKRNNVQLGAGYTMGANDFALTYTKVGNRDENGVSQADTGAKALTLTYAYNLSKRTALNASWAQITNDSKAKIGMFYNADTVVGSIGSGALAGEKHSAVSVGMRHAF